MANTIANALWVTKQVARGFYNDLKFLGNVNRSYDDQYKINGAKMGDTIKARLPQRFVVNDGQALQTQAIYDQTVNITMGPQRQVAWSWSSAEASLNLDDVKRRYTEPGGEALANAADVYAMETVYRDIYSAVGTPGTTPSATLTYLQAGVKLTDLGAPQSGRVAVLDQLAMATIANTGSTVFDSMGSGEGWKKGQWAAGKLGFSSWYQDPNMPAHTTGTFTASTPLIKGASQTGAVLITDGWASSAATLNKGDSFTIAGVYSVNPTSYVSTGRLQQFTVTATTSSSGVDMATLPVSPSIVTSGALQTVSNSPADDAVITVLGATAAASGTLATTVSKQSLVFHPDFMTFAMADLVKPDAGCRSEIVSSKPLGLSIRMVEQYQIGTDQNPSRLDFIAAAATLQARLACRVWG